MPPSISAGSSARQSVPAHATHRRTPVLGLQRHSVRPSSASAAGLGAVPCVPCRHWEQRTVVYSTSWRLQHRTGWLQRLAAAPAPEPGAGAQPGGPRPEGAAPDGSAPARVAPALGANGTGHTAHTDAAGVVSHGQFRTGVPQPAHGSHDAATQTARSSVQPLSSTDAVGGNGTGGSGEDHSWLHGRSSFRAILKQNYIGEMLFVVIGALMSVGLAQWTVGTPLRRSNPYSFHLVLQEAPGVVLGTPLRMKGVPMGSVLGTTPRLNGVDVEVEVNEAKTIIPRNAKFELTQSGLIPAASIDISPPEGISAEMLAAAVAARQQQEQEQRQQEAGEGAVKGSGRGSGRARSQRSPAKVRLAGPKDVDACRLQGVLVCQGDTLDGLQGGSMDELMARMLKVLREGEDWGPGAVPGRGGGAGAGELPGSPR